MSKFVAVIKKPEELKKGEFYIEMPKFDKEIKKAKVRLSNNNLTENYTLRNSLHLIAVEYCPAWSEYNVPIGNYEGIEYSSREEFSNIILNILDKHGPEVIDSYLTKLIKERPLDTKIIYFNGPFTKTGLFQQEGIDRLAEKEVNAYLKFETKTKAKPSDK